MRLDLRLKYKGCGTSGQIQILQQGAEILPGLTLVCFLTRLMPEFRGNIVPAKGPKLGWFGCKATGSLI
jgi:hypothetical protein